MWQLLILLYLVFGTTNYLIRRVLAQRLPDSNRLINAVFFLFFLLPAGAILFFLSPHNLNVGTTNLVFLFGGSVIWPLCYILAFEANKKTDAGTFAIINNLSPLFTLVIALPFLHETLKTAQFVGGGLLVVSGVLATASQFNKSKLLNLNGLIFCFLAAMALGVGVAYERFMLTRVDLGAYILYGWGAQIVWAVVLASSEFKKVPALLGSNTKDRSNIFLWGASKALGAMAFILALKLTSASIVSTASDFMSVAVVVAAYFYLKEREHLLYKTTAVVIGIAGLLLVAK